jgi:hypothetical protein
MRSWAKFSLGRFGLELGLRWGVGSGCGASGEGQKTIVAKPSTPVTGAPVLGGNAGSGSQNPGAPASDFGEGTGLNGIDLGDPVTMSKGCQQASRSFTPKTPTVFLVVDRSNSMFDPNPPGSNTNSWGLLRAGVLQVVNDLQADVHFGFGAFSSRPGVYASLPEAQADQECVDMPSVPPGATNMSAIATLYNSLEMAMNKDTPTVLALRRAARALWSDTTEGDKYILFVTDGEPDYCDDGNALCPPDSVVGKLQELALGLDETGATHVPIHTLVFGIKSPLSSVLPETLQAFANAGAGLPVAPPQRDPKQPYDPNSVYDQCNGVKGWATDFALTGKPAMRGQTIGTYIDPADPAQAAGTALVYRPDPTDQAALVQQIGQALASVKSCSFDLAGDGVKVDLTRADLGTLAKININGSAVPFDASNGWHMLSETTVQLEGKACADWRAPGQSAIDFDFPCDVIILR